MTEDFAVGPDGDRSIYVIPERNRLKFESKMEELSRRSVKLGFMPIKPILIGHHEVKVNGNVQRDTSGRPLYNLEYYLTAEMPVINGWTFVARIDHANETGNIVRSVPNTGVELPIQYRSAAPACDHCRINRKRRDTFVLHCKETGEFKQVGTSCLIDFFGHDPYKIARLAEFLGYADELCRAASSEEFHMRDKRWIDVAEYLEWVAGAIRTDGWVSGSAARMSRLTPTRTVAMRRMYASKNDILDYAPGLKLADAAAKFRADMVTPEDVALAAEALQWARGLQDRPELNEYLHNISVIANAVVMESRSTGYCASIIAAYQREQRDAKAAIEQEAARLAREARAKAEADARAAINTNVGDFTPVIALMKGDEAKKVRFSKLHLQLEDGTPVVLAIAGPNARQPGTVNVTNGGVYDTPDNIWFGRVTPQGKYEPNNRTYNYGSRAGEAFVPTATATAVSALLSRLAADPIKVAVEFGKLTNRCFACNLPLSDAKSAHMGYGPTCAKKLGWFYPTAKQFKGMIAEEVAG